MTLPHLGDYVTPRGINRASWSFMVAHHVAVIVTGLIGIFGDPSPSVSRIVGGDIASFLWSGLFVVFGSLALFARIKRTVSAEIWAVGAIALARLLWATMTVLAIIDSHPRADYGAIQTATELLAGTLFMVSWQLSAVAWLKFGAVARNPRSTEEVMSEVLREHLDGGGRPNHDQKD